MDELISRKETLQAFDNIPTINGLGLEPLIAMRDVKEIIKSMRGLPRDDIVSLTLICSFLAGYAAPPVKSPGARYGSLEEAWKEFLQKWIEDRIQWLMIGKRT